MKKNNKVHILTEENSKIESKQETVIETQENITQSKIISTKENGPNDPKEKPEEETLPNLWQELVVFGLALFLHSFIDGLTVGLFKDPSQLAVIGVSVTMHKIPVAFTLGFLFSRSNLTLKMWPTRIIFFLFLVSSPLGVVIGAVVSENLYDYALLIIQSFSAGTFVYLGCVDLIVFEFFTPENMKLPKKFKLMKVLSVLAGWGFVMILITFFAEHEGGPDSH
jgi:zinc transporter ZupT